MYSHNLLAVPPRLMPIYFTDDDVVLRLLEPDDIIPDEFKTGIRRYNYHWVWAAIDHGVAAALVIASPYHDSVLIGNVFAKPERGVLLGLLLRKMLNDVYARGFRTYFTFCSEELDAERKLLRIFKRVGAIVMESKLLTVGGAIADLRKW